MPMTRVKNRVKTQGQKNSVNFMRKSKSNKNDYLGRQEN